MMGSLLFAPSMCVCVCVWGNVCLRVFVKSFHQAKISTIRRMLLCQRVQSTIGLCTGSGSGRERGGRGGHLVAHLVLLSAVTGLCISLFGSASAAAAAWQRQCCIILLNSRCGFAISKSSSSAKGA